MSSNERLIIAKPEEHVHGLNAVAANSSAHNGDDRNLTVAIQHHPQRGSDSMHIELTQIIADCQEVSRRNEASSRLFVSPRAEDQIPRLEGALADGNADPAVKLALQWWRIEQAMNDQSGDTPEALTDAQSIVAQTLCSTLATTLAGQEAKLRIALMGILPEGGEMDPATALVLSSADDAISLALTPAAGLMEPADSSLDSCLLHMAAKATEGEENFDNAPDDDRTGFDQWKVNYAGLCQTPAWTLAGLAVKVRALMTEVTEGESFCGDDLRRTTDEALKRLIG